MINSDTQFAVIGHGSWATAIVKILTDNARHVHWYVRNGEVSAHIACFGNNPKYLSQVHFPLQHLTLHSDVGQAICSAQIIILATPSAFIKDVLADFGGDFSGKFVISAIKGIVPGQYLTIAEYMHDIWGMSYSDIGVITGPCHAEEVALERLSYLTMVCKNTDHAAMLAKCFATSYIKLNTSNDIYGAEYGAVLKNIYAIAVGMCHSLGYGDNFTAVLISNAAIEIEHFMERTFPFDRDILASAYLGDLLVTCYSQFSRNRTFGQMIGKGYSVKSAQMEMNMIAEGFYATACINQVKQRCGVEVNMPIVDAMYSILYERKSPAGQIRKILTELK